MKKRNLMLGSAILLVVLLVAGGTFAWFTATTDPVVNEFTAGTLDIKLVDEFEGATNVNPGDCYDKVVYIENTGSKRAVVRIKATFKMDGNEVTPEWLQLGTLVKMDLLNNGWIYEDGYYYYDGVVQPGDPTPNLIEKVCFDGPGIGNEWQGSKLEIIFEADAIQATNGAPTSEGWAIDPLAD